MLVRFICNNFLSFKDDFDFKMGTQLTSEKSNHICDTNDFNFNVLKGSIIYGANASGKSNLLKAIEFSRDFILYGRQDLAIKQNKFSNSKESKFEYFFIHNKKLYNYGFVLDASNGNTEIKEEWLVEKIFNNKKQNDIVIFERVRDKIEIGEEINVFEKEGKSREFVEFCIKACRSNGLFLNTLLYNNVKFIKNILKWFEKIRIIYGYNNIANSISKDKTLYKVDSDILFFLGQDIKNIDNKIDSIKVSKSMYIEGFEKFLNKIEMEQSDKNDIINMKINDTYFFSTKSNQKYLIEKDKDIYKEFFTVNLLMIERNKKYFTLQEESDGINKLIDLLISLYYARKNNLILFIDEIETNLHPLLLKYIIRAFFFGGFSDKKCCSQLIATTHNPLLINGDLFEKDEVKFIDKDKNLNSRIRALNEYKISDDLNIMKAYLSNRFGALPDLVEDYDME